MSSLRDEDLMRDPMIRRAVEMRRAATKPNGARSRHWPIGWLILAVVSGVVVIVLIGLIHLAG